MRQVGPLGTEADASRFGDSLLAQGIKNLVELAADETSWSVWVEDDDAIDRARAELDAFIANPADARYAAAAGRAEALRKQEVQVAERRRKLFVDVRTSWAQPRSWAVPVTLGLIGLSLFIGVLTRAWESQRSWEHEAPLENVLRIAPVSIEGDYA